jgi:hypothetical protein
MAGCIVEIIRLRRSTVWLTSLGLSAMGLFCVWRSSTSRCRPVRRDMSAAHLGMRRAAAMIVASTLPSGSLQNKRNRTYHQNC